MARLLIVEERPDRAEELARMLQFAMYEMDFVSDGEAALAYLRANPATDGLIANIIQGGIDGLHLCRSIKQEPRLAQIAVILISDINSLIGDEALARRAGAALLIRRPFKRESFLAEVDRALLMRAVQGNPLARPNPSEEAAFLRDYNLWLTRMLHQTNRNHERASYHLDLRDAHVHAINSVTTALGHNLNLPDTAQTLVAKTADLLRAQAVALYIYLEGNNFYLLHVTGVGISTPHLAQTQRIRQDSPLGALIPPQSALLFNDPDEIQALCETFELSIWPASLLASPLITVGDLNGFLLALRVDADNQFDQADADMLFSLSGAAGLAIRSAQLFTELQNAYENLREMDQRRSEFVAITSHELRTPIAIMLGYASLLRDLEENEDKRAQLATIEKQASFLTGMVDALINLHELSIEDDPVKLKCQHIDLPKLLQDAIDVTLNHSIYDYEVDFKIDCDPIEIIGDEVRLLLALNNLLDNAYKFSEAGASVEIIVAERPEGGVVITIADHGMGIDSYYHESIFEPFFQVEPAMTRHHGGLGLGLAIVKGLIGLHSGRVEVFSKLGGGSRFVVTLPAEPPPDRCFGF